MKTLCVSALTAAMSILAGCSAMRGSDRVEAAFPLVAAGGEAAAVVVRNTEGGAVVALAAEELINHIESITGVRLPETDAVNWDRTTPAIVLGRGELLDELGLEWEEPPPEGFRMQALPDREILVIAGRDRQSPWATAHPMNQHREYGTLYGVYDLLEQWGVRWLFAGELGTVIPSRETLHAPRVDRMDAPAFPRRNLWTNEEEPRTAFRDAGSPQRAARLHALRNRSGNATSEYSSGHHRPNWWSLWGESNPEYLGLFRGERGLRMRHPGRSKLCVSNPDVAEAVAGRAIEAFRGSSRMSYSIAEVDGSPGFCNCENCRALDEPRENETPYTEQTLGAPGVTPLTDRYVVFWNRVARHVEDAFPDDPHRYLGVYLYSFYSDAPRRETRLHPRIRAVYVNNGQVEPVELSRRLKAWSRATPHPITLYIPPMFGAWPHWDFGRLTLPVATLGNMHKGIEFCRETGINGVLINPNFTSRNVGSHGLIAYAYARWLWDPSRAPEDILDDFTRHAFGAAAGAMSAYFHAIEERQNAFPLPFVPRENAGYDRWVEHHLSVFTPEFMRQLEGGPLRRAWHLAKTEAQRERVALFRQNLRFTGTQLNLERAWRAFSRNETDFEPVLAAYRACEERYAQLRPENRPDNPWFRRGEAAQAVEQHTGQPGTFREEETVL